MDDFSDDANNNKVTPYISPEILEILYGLNIACFFEVSRYQYRMICYDFEIMSSIDYSAVLQNPKLERVTERITENEQQYNASDLAYLTIRHLIHHSWKLDVSFLLHLEKCFMANDYWNQILRSLSLNEQHFQGQPYWLRNELPGLIQDGYSDFNDILNKVEFVMVKSNTIFPQCSLLGSGQKAHYFVRMDSGMYPFLLEWIFILLSGFRINQFNESNNYMRATEPVRTGAILMLTVADIIQGHSSAFKLPVTTFNFSPNDHHIAKEIVGCQIGFLLRHECGHIYASEKHMTMEDKEEELFAVDLLSNSTAIVACINGKADTYVNDIQSESRMNRTLEDIELLFLFYDMYFYASEILGYENERDCSHPHVYDRRLNLKKYYPENKQIDLLKYAENFTERVKEEMRKNEGI